MCLIRAVGGDDQTADECLRQSDAAAADAVLMSADCETLAGELTLTTLSGDLLDPGYPTGCDEARAYGWCHHGNEFDG